MINKAKKVYLWAYNWCELTSKPVGWIVVLYLLATWLPYAAQKSFFSSTCTLAGWKCEYSWAATITAHEMAEALTDPEMDTTITQKQKKRS